jgi:tetratricopeptide (TPR) repeat protein
MGWVMQVIIYYQQKRYAEAIEPFQQAISIQKSEQMRQLLPANLGKPCSKP